MRMISKPCPPCPPSPAPAPRVGHLTSSPSSWMPPSTLPMSSVCPDVTPSQGWDPSPAPTPRTRGLSLWSPAWGGSLSHPWVRSTKSSRDRSWREKPLRTLKTATSRPRRGGKICGVIPWVPISSWSPQREGWSTRSPHQELQCRPSATISVEEDRQEARVTILLVI